MRSEEKKKTPHVSKERERLEQHRNHEQDWKRWGPYLSERAWGTVREDYSAGGDAWSYFPHEHARSRAYRWNEDGLAGFCDRQQHLCLALTLWNGCDPILKERFFGLTNPQGNHGEDVKEYYFYLDNTPTHSYQQMLYKYPQAAFPYDDLVAENGRRGRDDFEYELLDTGVFNENRYFDVFIEYAKAAEEDILAQFTVVNRGPETATCHLLPTLWFRNTWSWGYEAGPKGEVPTRPRLEHLDGMTVRAEHPAAGTYSLYAEDAADWLFTDNETNAEYLFGTENESPYVKDAFHRYLISGDTEAVNPEKFGTKVAALYKLELKPGESKAVRLRLSKDEQARPFEDFADVLATRKLEADSFYTAIQKATLSEDERRVQRQALAGMLWGKQFYYYDVLQWLRGDPGTVTPPRSRWTGRNSDWEHLTNFDVISMPDSWEYPWYAAWDLAFHCIPLALVDADFAKRQLTLITREWYLHPNGQMPAYEWNFSDVNPPVHAWAAWRVYQMDAAQRGEPDRPFLEGMFHKLLLNFTWWVNRKDSDGNNIFQGGFLGLDNIGVFDRSKPLPNGQYLSQADATSWMAAFCLTMLRMALELAKEEPVYQDSASKFFEHFLRIADAMNRMGHDHYSLWDELDGFFYDALHYADGRVVPLKVRSLVGLLPLCAVEVLEPGMLERMPVFEHRMRWFLSNRPLLSQTIVACELPNAEDRRLLSLLTPDRLRRVLSKLLDESEFLSDYGVRSVSKYHEAKPYTLWLDGQDYSVHYEPAESRSGLFGGNSNWRGPIWFPINYLLLESLQRFHDYYGESFKVECPTSSGQMLTLAEVATELSRRLTRLFLRDEQEKRPIYGGVEIFQQDPQWRDYLLFNEYFHGDNGAGLGASHQTGWTGLVANLLQQSGGH